jgi:hypothetical protein
MLKTQPKQLLGSLPLDIALPKQMYKSSMPRQEQQLLATVTVTTFSALKYANVNTA